MGSTRILPSRFLNTSLIRATADVHDDIRKSSELKAADLRRVQVSLRFEEAFSTIHGRDAGIQFDPADCALFCDVDAPTPSVRLDFRGGRYTGLVPRGRLFPDHLPNYYWFRLRAGRRDFPVARVPVVHRVTITNPTSNSSHFIDEDVAVTMECASWSVFWDNTDPHYQFEHSETVTLTEHMPDDSMRVVGGRTVRGDHGDATTFATSPARPYATPGSRGGIYCVTEYRSNDQTEGPTEFMLDGWLSSAGATPVPITWRL